MSLTTLVTFVEVFNVDINGNKSTKHLLQNGKREPNKDVKDKIKRNYLARHRNDPKGMHSPSTLSDMLLWNKPNLKQSIKDYEKKYNVSVVIKP